MRLRADQRLFLSYLALIAMVVAALSVGADLLLRRQLTQLVRDDLRRELLQGRALYEALPGAGADSVADLLGTLSGRRVTIIGPAGRVLGESTRDGAALAAMEGHADRPEVVAARAGRLASAIRRSATLRADLLYMAVVTTRGNDVVRFAVPLVEIDAALGRVQRSILGVGAVALVVAAVFSFGFSLAVTRRLRRVTAAATTMAAGDLGTRLREPRRDELGELAAAVDSLAEQLQRRISQLEDERAETQALIDSMAEGVLALAPDGTVRRANPAARRIFKLPARPDGLAPEAVARRPEFLRLVSSALRGETVSATELTADGRALLATAHPLPDGGSVLVFLDVSELRRLEGVRRDFVANASHELKTPLTAIRGYSETLLDPDLPPELTRRFAEIVRANAERLQRIVDDLLDLSRIESGGWVIHPEPTSLAEMVHDAWNAQPAPSDGKHVDLVTDLDPEAAWALCDPDAVRQILVNLFSNSIRYTPDGGTVTVRTRAVPAQPAKDDAGGWLTVEVTDTGSGIPSVHLPRIFERFYRTDPARSRAEGGTGLGLAIVKHLVEAHGGQVEAESFVGQGTTIRFFLPSCEG